MDAISFSTKDMIARSDRLVRLQCKKLEERIDSASFLGFSSFTAFKLDVVIVAFVINKEQ